MICHAVYRVALPVLVAGACIAAGCKSETTAPVESLSDSGRSKRPTPSALSFRRVPSESLGTFVYQNGREAQLNSILEIVGGGVACLDFDLDGHCDLFFPGGGRIDASQRTTRGEASKLFRAAPEWSYRDVSRAARVADCDLYSHGVAAGDYDNDGFTDLLVGGYRGVRLLRNQGDGTFQNVTGPAGLQAAPWTSSMAWADFNGDSALDLYLTSYVIWDFDSHQVCPTRDGKDDVCSPNAFASSPDAVLLSNCDGTFEDASRRLLGDGKAKGLGVLAADVNGDRQCDVYVANDLTPNFLYVPQDDGTWQECAFRAGVAADAAGKLNASMGLALLDFDGDQQFDMLVTNFENEVIALYQNEGDTMFRHASRAAGLAALDARVVGFGVVAADFDCDGDEDVLLTSGHVQYHPKSGDMRQPAVLLENLEGRRFERRIPPACSYFKQPHVGRGVASADLDNDGDPDLVISQLFEPPVLLENTRRNQNAWLRLRLIGRDSCRTPVGAVATLRVGGRSMARQLHGGGSYLSQSQPELGWGWSGSEPAQLSVLWPNGRETRLVNVKPNQRLTLVEPLEEN